MRTNLNQSLYSHVTEPATHGGLPATARNMLLAALLGGLCVSAPAWASDKSYSTSGKKEYGERQKERKQERRKMQHEMHLAYLKEKLQIRPEQQAAWKAYVAATQLPPVGDRKKMRAHFAEMKKLATPERIEKMRQLQKEQHETMSRHDNAILAFYAKLDAGQKKTYDKHTMMFGDMASGYCGWAKGGKKRGGGFRRKGKVN